MSLGLDAGEREAGGAASGVGHDLRHGLGTLQALLRAAQAGESLTSSQLRSLVDAASNEVDYAVQLLDELPASVASTAAPQDQGMTDPDSAGRPSSDLDAALRTAARALGGAGPSIRIQSEGPLWVPLPSTAVTRVIRNLLGNAVSAAQPHGAILVRAQFVPVSPETGGAVRHIRLEIHDDGPGPGPTGFFRTGGQGLDIVRSIVLPAHGWLVLGRSTLGGACVHVTLPEAREEE